jgi:hypothetical protein
LNEHLNLFFARVRTPGDKGGLMSRELPEFPDLDYLRKQAKVRLRELQQRNAGAKLTEAQLAIAREYGFASWTKLKKYIESLPRPAMVAATTGGSGSGGGGAVTTPGIPQPGDPGSGLFVRFALRTRRVIFFARYFAAQHGSATIETHHLLLGLLQEDENLIKRLLNKPPAADDVRARIEARVSKEGLLPEPRSIPLSPDFKQMLQRSAEEADRLGHANISAGHFWLAFLREEVPITISVLIDILKQNGISLDKARNEIIAILSEEPSE